MLAKKCSKCGIEKELYLYYKNSGGKFNRASICKECQKPQQKQWYLENKEKVFANSRKWMSIEKNRKQALENRKKKRRAEGVMAKPPAMSEEEARESNRLSTKKYIENNKEKVRLAAEKKRRELGIFPKPEPMSEEERKESTRQSNIRSYYRNREKYLVSGQEWKKANMERCREYDRKAQKKKMSTPKGVLNLRMASGIRRCLKNGKGGYSWEAFVDYDVYELKAHLEKLFTDTMSWEVFLSGAIHIDHIKPISLFDYDSSEDVGFKECWALSNLQPLWASDNIAKGNKY